MPVGKSHEFVQSVLDAIPGFALLVNASGIVVMKNSRFREAFESNGNQTEEGPGDVVGCRNALKSGCGNGQACASCEIRKSVGLALEGNSTCVQAEWNLKSGIVYIEMQASKVDFFDENHAVLAIRDVTKKILLLREAEGLQAQLLENMRFKDAAIIASGASHEIRNPLAILSANLEFMDEYFRNRDETAFASAGSACTSAIARIDKIIMGLVDFSIEKTPSTAVAVNDLTAVTVAVFAEEWKTLGVDVQIRDLSGKSFANMNPSGFRDALKQVLLNARDALAGVARQRKLTLVIRAEGPSVAVEISDNGMGIPSENLDSVFIPFFSTKRPRCGVGLGLTMARSAMEAMGGKIDLKSREGEGTTVTLRVPKMERGV
jgi:signal transduction histidine kinase